MTTSSKHANSQSISAQMQKGQAAVRGRMLANLRKIRDNTNSPFCTPIATQADVDKSRMIHKAFA